MTKKKKKYIRINLKIKRIKNIIRKQKDLELRRIKKMMKENKNNPVNLFDKNSDSRRKKNANNIVKFAGTGGFTTVHDNFEIYHLPVTCTPMPLIERDYNYR